MDDFEESLDDDSLWLVLEPGFRAELSGGMRFSMHVKVEQS